MLLEPAGGCRSGDLRSGFLHVHHAAVSLPHPVSCASLGSSEQVVSSHSFQKLISEACQWGAFECCLFWYRTSYI